MCFNCILSGDAEAHTHAHKFAALCTKIILVYCEWGLWERTQHRCEYLFSLFVVGVVFCIRLFRPTHSHQPVRARLLYLNNFSTFFCFFFFFIFFFILMFVSQLHNISMCVRVSESILHGHTATRPHGHTSIEKWTVYMEAWTLCVRCTSTCPMFACAGV